MLSLLVVATLSAEPEVNVRLLEGESFVGRLAELSPANATVETAAGSKQIATAKLMWVELSSASSTDKPTIWIDLLDGSRLCAIGYTAAKGQARVELATRQTVEIPTRAIEAVRFHQQSPELAAQWREIAASKT